MSEDSQVKETTVSWKLVHLDCFFFPPQMKYMLFDGHIGADGNERRVPVARDELLTATFFVARERLASSLHP